MAGFNVFGNTPKRKRAPRSRWTPEQERIRQENNFLKTLKNEDYDLWKTIMLRKMFRPSVSLGGEAPQGDDLREKLIDVALRLLDGGGPSSIKQNLEILKTLLSFTDALPKGNEQTGIIGVIQEAIRSGPEYVAALKGLAAQPDGAEMARLLAAAQQSQNNQPPADYSARNNEPEQRQLELPQPQPSAPADPVADLVGKLIPLLDLPPAQAAAALAAVLYSPFLDPASLWFHLLCLLSG